MLPMPLTNIALAMAEKPGLAVYLKGDRIDDGWGILGRRAGTSRPAEEFNNVMWIPEAAAAYRVASGTR